MKKSFLFLLSLLSLAACSKSDAPESPSTIISFEDAPLDSTGSLFMSPYSSGIISLTNNYDTTYSYWEGFAVSNNVDTVDGSPLNQFSVVSGAAHSGSVFAVAYAGYTIPTALVAQKDITPLRLFINNSTYVYNTLLNGNAYSRAFADGDYYSVTFSGISATGDTTGSVTAFLADFRDGQHIIVKSWQEVNLTPLGTCRRIALSFASTDVGDFGINTPCYAVIDDFEFRQ